MCVHPLGLAAQRRARYHDRPMSKAQRIYALPPAIIEAFSTSLRSHGRVLSHALAAAMLHFLDMSPADREACIDRYHAYARDVLGDDYNPRKRRTGGPRKRRSTLRPYRDRNAAMRLNIPPPDQQMVIGGKISDELRRTDGQKG